MSLAYIFPVPGQDNLFNVIELSPASPPPRPHPQPPLGIWGPNDPRPGNPISGIPGMPGWDPGIWGPNDPRPSHPIAGIPGFPGYTPPPGGGGGGGQPAAIFPMPAPPEGTPPATPPEGVPADSTQVMLWMGPGTLPVPVWVPPYVSHHNPAA